MLCEAVCGIEVRTGADGRVSIRGDRADPFSAGHICPKATALPDIADDPDRLRAPIRRRDAHWGPIFWDAAISEASERLCAIAQEHGPGSVAFYAGNPTVHSYGAMLGYGLLQQALPRSSRFSATSVDQLPHMLAAQQMFGHQLLLPVPDIDRTDFFLVLGANPLASNGSIMTAPDMAGRIKQLRQRGGRMVVVDPRCSETAQVADAHHFIRPGTDVYLLMALLQTIFADGMAHSDLACDNVDDLQRLVNPVTPARAAEHTGIDAPAIRALAHDFAQARTAVCYGRVGACTQRHGGLVGWLLVALNAVTGNLDRPGGAMFAQPAIDLRSLGGGGHFGKWRSRVRQLPEFSGELPAAALAEEIDTPGKGKIRALVTLAGNPVLSLPNGKRLERALAGLDFMLSIDLYKNETTRHAHMILPTSFGLERDHYDLVFYGLSVRNAARYVDAIMPAPPDVRDDWDVLSGLAQKVSQRRRAWAWMGGLRVMRAIGQRRILDGLLRTGPYGVLRGGKLSLRYLQDNPHGVDLGPLKPCLAERMPRARIDLAPKVFAQHLATLNLAPSPTLKKEPGGTLQLIGRRHLRSNNSWMHNTQRLIKGPPRCVLLMHPEDAVARGLEDKAQVRITSRTGSVVAPMSITDTIAPGVVSLPHGFGHHRPGTMQQVARAHAGVSINDLTDETHIDDLSATTAFSGVPVRVCLADA